MVVDGDAAPAADYLLDVAVRLLAGTRPLARGARVHVHHGTRETPARVAPLEGERLEPGEAGLVQLRLERPLVPVAGDRFVLRQLAPPDTLGGGRVLDPSPRKHGPGRSTSSAWGRCGAATRSRRCGSSSRQPARASRRRTAQRSWRAWPGQERPCRSAGRAGAGSHPRCSTKRAPL